jgi:hypothetical protein
MKKYLLVVCLLVASAKAATWSKVQMTTFDRFKCDVATDSCSIAVAAIGSGNQLNLLFADNYDPISNPQRTLTSVYDCATCPCNAGNTINNWVLHHSVGDDTRGYSPGGNITSSTDIATVASSVPGAVCITFTRSGHSSNERYGGELIELSTTVGAAHVESAASAAQTSTSFTHIMVATTVTGNDAIVQVICDAPSSISSPYNTFYSTAHFGYALALNTNDGTAPTWVSGSNDSAAGSAVAWAEGPAGHAPLAPAGALFAEAQK